MVAPTPPAEKIDQAALMGAATVGILALVLGEGPWDPTATIFGVILLVVLFAYYRPPTTDGVLEPISKSLAFSATASLLCFIAIAYPFQELIAKRVYGDLAAPSAQVESFCAYLSSTPPDGKTVTWVKSNCWGYLTTDQAPIICGVSFVISMAIWWSWRYGLRVQEARRSSAE